MHDVIVRELHGLLATLRAQGELLAAPEVVAAAVRGLALVHRLDPSIAGENGESAELTCVVADDHPAVAAAVAEALGSHGVAVVGEALDGAAALAAIELLRPRVAILDVRMPELDGVEVARRAATVSPETAIVVFTGFADDALVEDALAAGALGVVSKDAPLADLVRAVEFAAAGRTFVHPEISARGLRGETAGLTEREREVLGLAANGLTNADIASRLSISSETVQSHVRKAMAKLQTESRTAAVAKALRLTLIE